MKAGAEVRLPLGDPSIERAVPCSDHLVPHHEESMTEHSQDCLVCKRSSEEVPLISFRFKARDLFICPQHLPILIHDPGKLAQVLPGAEALDPADHHD